MRTATKVVRQLAVAGGLAAAALGATLLEAQQPGAAGQQQPGAAGQGAGGQAGPGGAGGGAQRPPAPPPTPDGYEGFRSIFDGRTLTGWDGDPMFWRVENGSIVAESTPEKVVQSNTFLIWRDGTLRDFELKVDVRFAANQGNTGLQVRSKPSAPGRNGEPRPWGIAGPQVDVVAGATAGNALIYEEGGRGHLARQGQITRRITNPDGTGGFTLIGTLGDNITSAIRPAGEWNTFHVVARGNQLTVFVNGRLSAMTIDDDAPRRSLEGLLALQMHTGQPFKLEFRNIFLKEL